ncbi:MAG: hypothetical protein OEZ40_11630 [Candidatus Bathyarchaeota archaeon]|nr:hypothetical protein [Candidatus Bathyarchaeota archaeon]
MGQPRGKRSLNGRIKQKAREYIWKYSFNDVKKCETVCLTNREEIMDFLLEDAEVQNVGIQLSQVPDVRRGLVLTDSRGEGWYQT